jgi:hypothetical protein
MNITVTRTFEPVTKTISRCVECPYFGNDGGGPGQIMICEHPAFVRGTYEGAIISHPTCDVGFPEKCPLLEQNANIQCEDDLELESCQQCNEKSWDGYICHSCGMKEI